MNAMCGNSNSNMIGRPDDQTVSSTPVSPLRRRYRLTIAYDGTDFHGWQKQEPPGSEPLRTVQGELERVISRLLQQPVSLRGASRTDAGVHAVGQSAVFDAAGRVPADRMAHAINSRLPGDIDIRHVEIVPDDFDYVGSVVSKQYCYRIYHSSQRPLGLRHMVYHNWLPLDVARMAAGAKQLVGCHDFAGFATAGHGRESTVRTIHDCRVYTVDPEIRITVAGDGFLYNMVRIIAGTLLEIGRGRFDPEQIDLILSQRDRRLAGPTLEPQGLCLEWIRFA